MLSFELINNDGRARRGKLITPSGQVNTPAFMPVGTLGSVKGITPDQLRACGAQMLLANTYHLMLRPGAEEVAALGGLHRLMGWDGPILTDSGGYQVYSLAHMRKIDDDGVSFRSHVDGSLVRLTPEGAIDVQRLLGADIIMQLDECPPGAASKEDVAAAVRRSTRWARICHDRWRRTLDSPTPPDGRPQALFGIQQGGVFEDLRVSSAASLVELDLPGYAIGGLSVGEGHDVMLSVLNGADRQLPTDRPRYLMGVGQPRDILAAVARGVDMFDCVLPTRNGRNAQAFTWSGRLRLRNARWTSDTRPIEDGCDCYGCRNFSRGALRHLFMAREMLGPILVTIHNLHFFTSFMSGIRDAISAGNFTEMSRRWLGAMYAADAAESDE